MRCSSFELTLDALVEGRMHLARRARMQAHADGCPRCAALLAEYRAIDALLNAPRTLEPAPNFTFKVMAELRPLPAPRAHRSPTFAILATYVAFGWVTIGSFLVLGGVYARAMLATLGLGFGQAGAVWKMLAGVTGRTFGSRAFDVTAAMGGLLAADFTVVALVVALYAVRRSRWAANARASESC